MKNEIGFIVDEDETLDFLEEQDELEELRDEDFIFKFKSPVSDKYSATPLEEQKDCAPYVFGGFVTATLIGIALMILAKGAYEHVPLTTCMNVTAQMIGIMASMPLTFKKLMARIKEAANEKSDALPALHVISGVYRAVLPMMFATAILVPACTNMELLIVLSEACVLFGMMLVMYMYCVANLIDPSQRKLLRQNAYLIGVSLVLPVIELILSI